MDFKAYSLFRSITLAAVVESSGPVATADAGSANQRSQVWVGCLVWRCKSTELQVDNIDEMRRITHTISILLLTGSGAFSPYYFNSFTSRNLNPSRADLLASRYRSVAFAATSDRHVDRPASRINQDARSESEMERFVSDMRQLYRDLEYRGGTVRRQLDGVAFTYVSPVITSTDKKNRNKQLDGAWRLQTPRMLDKNAILTGIHQRSNLESAEKEAIKSSEQPPLLLYVPGLDGFGISATAQFDDLSSSFEFWRLTIDRHKDQSFSDLVIAIVKFVNGYTGSTDPPREVILVGESFGGVLALSVAMALTKTKSSSTVLKGLVLVNPATSFDETSWENFVPLLTSLRHLESRDQTTPTLPTPYSVLGSMALTATVPDRSQLRNIASFILQSVSSSSADRLLSASSDGLSILTEYLSASMLDRRVLNWLPVGTAVVNNARRLSKLNIPTLVIGGTGDNMLPTKNEVNRLGKLLPNCVKMEVSGAGHFVLDTRLNLTEIILDSHIFPLDSEKAYDPVMDWTLPPTDVVKAVIERIVVPQRERTSPVYFSTDPNSGKRRRGLSHVPATSKPLLIVGNHQLFGQDLGMIISELLEERGIIARGLAHPIALGGFTGPDTGANKSIVREQKRRWEFDENSQSMTPPTALFSMFGAVKVSPRNFYRLLQTNQTVLLFPGGTREALHGKDEAYQLFWPEKVDFVRVAAKFNATIVPLSAIGAADSVEIFLDAPDLLKLPFGIGDNLANFTSSAPSARFDAANEDELFLPPLALPKPFSARHYFLFGKPYDTTLVDAKDQDACLLAYKAIKEEVEQDIQALLEARKHDTYAFDGVKRSSYQRFFGKAPPTFPLESLSPSSRITTD